MDIFIIEIIDADSMHMELLRKFQKKEINNPEKWNIHCLSYLMVDRILKEVYQIEDRDVVFENKKPVLKSGKKHFSISHSGEYIALAFSDNACGIDIEEIKPRSFTKIADRMGFFANTSKDFYYEWTKFEAKYKLAVPAGCSKSCNIENYILTAVSADPYEKYDIYMQKKEAHKLKS